MQDEFFDHYGKFSKDMGNALSASQLQDKWALIDNDDSGDVSPAELAEFFGFEIKGGHVVKKEDGDMDDDAILQMLQVCAHGPRRPAL